MEASVTSTVSAAVSDGSFASALTAAVSSTGYSGDMVVSDLTVTGVSVSTEAPTPAPVDDTPSSVVVASGSGRLMPSFGFLGACAAVIATAWV